MGGDFKIGMEKWTTNLFMGSDLRKREKKGKNKKYGQEWRLLDLSEGKRVFGSGDLNKANQKRNGSLGRLTSREGVVRGERSERKTGNGTRLGGVPSCLSSIRGLPRHLTWQVLAKPTANKRWESASYWRNGTRLGGVPSCLSYFTMISV